MSGRGRAEPGPAYCGVVVLVHPRVAGGAQGLVALVTLVAVAPTLAATSGAAPAPAAPCTDVTNPAGPATVDDLVTATFGPLAAWAVLDHAVTAPGSIADARRVPGGLLVTAVETPASGMGDDEVDSVSFVEYSGALRWKRCVRPFAWALAGQAWSGGTTAIIAEVTAFDAPAAIRAVDLASGDPAPLPKAFGTGDLTPWAASGDFALFGAVDDGPLDSDRPFLLVDLATMAVTAVPVPPGAAGVEFPDLAVTDDGVVTFGNQDGFGARLAAFIDGAWTSEAAALDAALPPWTDYATDRPISYFTASGAPAFTVADLVDPGDEGFRNAVSGGMVIVRGCAAPQDGWCEPADMALVGVELATGTERWRRPGDGGVYAAGDGYALITSGVTTGATPAPAVLIDAVTGEAIDGQTWPPGTFLQGCCGDPAFTRADGGAVLTSDGSSLRVFLPLGVAAGAVPTVPG